MSGLVFSSTMKNAVGWVARPISSQVSIANDSHIILAELQNNKCPKLSDVKDCFQLMFDNCYAYNPSRSVFDVYME